MDASLCLERQTTQLLGPLCSVFGASLFAVFDTLGVEHAAQDVVTHPWKILHATTTDQNHRVLLQVMSLPGDIADHFESVGEANLGDLAQSRVRLLRGRGV